MVNFWSIRIHYVSHKCVKNDISIHTEQRFSGSEAVARVAMFKSDVQKKLYLKTTHRHRHHIDHQRSLLSRFIVYVGKHAGAGHVCENVTSRSTLFNYFLDYITIFYLL